MLFGVFGLFPLVYTLLDVAARLGACSAPRHRGVGLRQLLASCSPTSDFWNAVVNTLGMFLLSTVPQLLLALFLANPLNQRLRGRTLLPDGRARSRTSPRSPRSAIVFTQLFGRDFGLDQLGARPGRRRRRSTGRRTAGRPGSAIASMVDWRWTGYNALIFLAAMQAIPRDLYESAAIDGASAGGSSGRITVPMLRPTIIFIVDHLHHRRPAAVHRAAAVQRRRQRRSPAARCGSSRP